VVYASRALDQRRDRGKTAQRPGKKVYTEVRVPCGRNKFLSEIDLNPEKGKKYPE